MHDLLGGELVVAQVVRGGEVQGVHYWNRLPSGIEIDLTREQFLPDEPLHDPRGVERRDPQGGGAADVAYRLLRARVLAILEPSTGSTAAGAGQPAMPTV